MDQHKQCVECAQRKPLAEFYINRRERDGRQRRCKPCQKQFMADWYKANAVRVCARTQAWKRDNPERRRANNAQYRSANLDKSATATLWLKAKKINAIPAWADRDAIARLYAEAAKRTRATGIRHQVDHIVPLISDVVCGLHVQDNLQVLTMKENRAKGNKRWPDMPGRA